MELGLIVHQHGIVAARNSIDTLALAADKQMIGLKRTIFPAVH